MNINIKGANLELPTFFPDATKGVIRNLDSTDLTNVNIKGLVVNTYHLSLNPGASVIKNLGGIKKFINWNRFIISDSGGFQLLSLVYKNTSVGSINDKGIVFYKNKKKYNFTPQKSIQIQFDLQSDIIICLDDCPKPNATKTDVEQSVTRTIEWAKACKKEYLNQLKIRKIEPKNRPLIFGVIQGEDYKELRKKCAQELIKIGFDGYGFGGWPLTKENKLNEQILEYTANLMPNNKPKYALGVGELSYIVSCVKMGYSIFDAVLPTRNARHKKLYVLTKDPKTTNFLNETNFYQSLYIAQEKYKRDNQPISTYCDCHLCKNYTRAYLNHLFEVGENLAERLATIHNLKTYEIVMQNIRRNGK